MKRYRFYTGMMAAALLLSACSGDEDAAVPQETGGGTQQLAITTRAAEETRAFDNFNLYLSDSETNTKTEEHLLTWDETASAWLEDGQPCATSLLPAIVNASVCDSPDQITFSSNASNTEFYATYNNIPTDQSTADKLTAAGKPMFVCGRRLNAGEELSLDFLHACTKLVFNVDKDEVIANGGNGVLSNIKVTALASSKYYIKSNANAGSWIAAGSEGNFSCFYDETDGTITVYTGFTSYYSNQRIMTLDVDGISRRVLMKGNLKVIPGNIYTFDLKVGSNYITLQDISIEAWQEGEPQGGNTTNIALPEAADTQAGIFIHYADGDADNADNLTLGADASQMIDHVWKSSNAKPHIVIYSPYDANATYTGTTALAYGTDHCYASINAGGTQTVSQLLGGSNTLTVGDAYQHVMGKLTLVFEDCDGNTITPDEVKLNNFYENATLALKNGTVSTTGNRTREIGIDGYDALYVIPQTIPQYGDMVSATYNGTKYIYTTPDDFTFSGGEHVTLTLTIPATSTRSAAGDAPRRMEGTITIEKEDK